MVCCLGISGRLQGNCYVVAIVTGVVARVFFVVVRACNLVARPGCIVAKVLWVVKRGHFYMVA